jgi:hypothetical protein
MPLLRAPECKQLLPRANGKHTVFAESFEHGTVWHTLLECCSAGQRGSVYAASPRPATWRVLAANCRCEAKAGTRGGPQNTASAACKLSHIRVLGDHRHINCARSCVAACVEHACCARPGLLRSVGPLMATVETLCGWACGGRTESCCVTCAHLSSLVELGLGLRLRAHERALLVSRARGVVGGAPRLHHQLPLRVGRVEPLSLCVAGQDGCSQLVDLGLPLGRGRRHCDRVLEHRRLAERRARVLGLLAPPARGRELPVAIGERTVAAHARRQQQQQHRRERRPRPSRTTRQRARVSLLPRRDGAAVHPVAVLCAYAPSARRSRRGLPFPSKFEMPCVEAHCAELHPREFRVASK